MANANDVAVNAQYRGDSNLGGANFGIISIDTQPLQNLAAYTYAYNKTKWEQTQKDSEAKAKELAQVTAYNLSTAIPKDSKEIRQKYNEFYSWVQKNPTVLDYKNNEAGWLEYNKRKNDFQNDLVDAKSRNITYMAGLAAIEKETKPEAKAVLQKRLDDQAQNTDLRTPIRLQEYDASIPAIPVPSVQKFDVGIIDQNGNFMADREVGVVSMKDINAKASAIGLGLQADVLDQNSAEFTALTPEAQKLKIEEFQNRKASGRLLVVDQAATYTDALKSPEFQNADGTINLEKIRSSNPILGGTMKAFDDYNNYVNGIREQIKAGVFKDKQGVALQFGMKNLDEYDYQPIDYADGITPDELLKVQLLSKALPDTYATSTKQTNLAIDKDKNALGWANLKLNKDEFGLKQKQFEASQKGSETQVNGAMERAKRIYGEMQQLADKNGLITPDKLRQLTVEQLKYLGIDSPEERDESGAVITPKGFRPLDLQGTEGTTNMFGNVKTPSSQYAIQLVDGNIKVLSNAKKVEGTNQYEGQFDNKKSTTLFNVATNILNEELKNAGSKELNSYWGVDVTGGNTSFTQEKSSTKSSSSSSVKGKQISRGDIATKAAAAGYTPAEYEALLRKNGVNITN